jgi:hypothetical protein
MIQAVKNRFGSTVVYTSLAITLVVVAINQLT